MKIVLKNITFFILLFVSILWSNNSIAQEVEINIGKNNIALNEYFTLSITVKNGKIKSYSGFPQIKGFDQRGVSNQSSTNIINGRMSQEFSLVQNYQARKEGVYKLNPFEITINGVAIPSGGTTIKVGPARDTRRSNNWDPFADLFGRGKQQSQEFVEVKDDAFFAITTDKKSVYSGEGFNLQIGFFIAEQNRAQMDFHQLSEQLSEVIKKVKPKNCWEENFEIKEIKPEVIQIGGKRYTQYKLFEANYYPLSENDIVIKSMPWKMVKYKVAKQQSFFGNNHQKDFKTYYSTAKTIKVKPLPEHPLKDQVSVGAYKLLEGVNRDTFQTGESFNYQFSIAGEGNISGIKSPTQKESSAMQIYEPNELQSISRSGGRVVGKKVFDYYMIPDEPGKYNMKEFLEWIYFNVNTEKYDTLTSNASFTVTGESTLNSAIKSSDLGDFYDRIPFEDTTLKEIKAPIDVFFWMQLVILAVIGYTGYVYFKKG